MRVAALQFGFLLKPQSQRHVVSFHAAISVYPSIRTRFAKGQAPLPKALPGQIPTMRKAAAGHHHHLRAVRAIPETARIARNPGPGAFGSISTNRRLVYGRGAGPISMPLSCATDAQLGLH